MKRVTRRILSLVFVVAVTFCCWVFFSDSDIKAFTVPATAQSDRLCVIVPFRDRKEELDRFAPHMQKFLAAQGVDHVFLIMNQVDSNRFNRASLINVGWYEADRLSCNYMVMHDVDLLPMNPALNYRYPGEGVVRHLASPEYHPKYNYTKYIGGILMLTIPDFKKVNGMSNKYWGWGMEDDEFYFRLRDQGLLSRLERPMNLTTDNKSTFLHNHDKHERKRDNKNIYNQREMSRRRDRMSGLDDVNYKIYTRKLTKIQDVDVTIVDVELICEYEWTPYCTYEGYTPPPSNPQ